MEIDSLAAQSAIEDGFEFISLVGSGQVAGACVGNEKGVENNAVGSSKDLSAKDVQASDAERAGDIAEESGTVPGADFDGVVTAVEFVVPIDDRNQRG